MVPVSEFLFNDRRTLYEQRFTRLLTLKFAYCHLFINVFFLLLIVAICMHMRFLPNWDNIIYLNYSQVILWTASLGFHYLYTSHHWYLKIKGYFKFYNKLKNYTHFIISVPSFFNVIIIITLTVSSAYIPQYNQYINIYHYVTSGILISELILSIVSIICYIVKVHKFNAVKPVPDTELNDYFLVSDAACSSEIGYRLDGEAVADLLEKQADLILYLKSTIAEMNNRLVHRP